MFYDNLKTVCEEKNLKITNVVLECGGNKGSLSGWKKGASPNSEIVMKLSVRLNVPTDTLLFGKCFDNGTTSKIEKELLNNFRKLSEYQKGKIMGKIEDMIEDNQIESKENVG